VVAEKIFFRISEKKIEKRELEIKKNKKLTYS